MNKEPFDNDMPVGELTIMEDFLPPPEKLVFKQRKKRTSIELHETTLDFFKAKAKELDVPYQVMIRELLDSYANKYSSNPDRH